MKKLISLVMIFTLMMSTFAYADTVNDGLDISHLDPAIQDEINKIEGEVVSITETYANLDEDGNLVQAYGTMPTSDFKMTVVAQRVEGEDGMDTFRFTAAGEWLVNPFYEFTDTIALTWSDDFTLDSHYSYIRRGSVADFTDSVVNKIVPEAGVAYDANLRLGKSDDIVFLSATVYKHDSVGSANVVGEYGHVILNASSVSVGFDSGKTVNMSVGIQADIEMASPDFDSFNY